MIHGLAEARAANAAGRPALVWSRAVADTETPVSAWLKLAGHGRGDWLLESVEGGRIRGRYSMLGLDPDRVLRVQGDHAEVNPYWPDPAGWRPAGDPLAALRAEAQSIRMDVPPGLPPALALLVGYMAYETARLAERLPTPADPGLNLPTLFFVRPRLVLVFDRLADVLHLVAPAWPGDPHAAQNAADRIDSARARLAGPIPTRPVLQPATGTLLPPGQGGTTREASEGGSNAADRASITAHTPPETYARMVASAKNYIAAGDIFQVVLAQRFSRPFALPPFELYRSLRRVNPSPFLYHLDLPGFALTGSSPEILVRARNGEITVRPIAGTRPRGATDAEDADRRAELLADPKELAEHLMLLDLGRNDAGRVSVGGSVRVTERFTVELYSHVMHIVSNVVGTQRPDADAIDALLAGFPAGTVSGAPKIRAMEIIAELESEQRGPYAGGVGYFGPDGGMDSCIVLRTAVVKDGIMHVQAGAGIVADSDPAAEQRECEAKSGALLAAATEAERVAGEGGYQ